MRLAAIFTRQHFLAGQEVFEQGDGAESLYLLLVGQVAIQFKPEDGPELTVAKILPGGVLGWSAVLGSPCYTSSADCLEDSLLLKLPREELRALCLKDERMGVQVLDDLAEAISQRLRNTHTHVFKLLVAGLRLGWRPPYAGLARTEGQPT